MRDLMKHVFTDPEWGRFVVYRPVAIDGDPWGQLAPIRGTEWAGLIPVIPGEFLSHALYGRTLDLIQKLGPDPKKLGVKLTPAARICVDAKTCVTYNPRRCWPQANLPDCYQAPLYPDILSDIALRWKEGAYVAVFTEGEFSL